MQVVKTANNDFRVTVTNREARIFVNCMRASVDEIMRTVFRTRVGSQPEEIETIASALETALS